MATAKEYEIVFMMKAALDSSMNQFSVTGGKIAELQNRIEQYQNAFRNIDAFRQHQTGLEKLQQDYQNLQTAIQAANQKFNAATAAVQQAEQACRQHADRIKEINIQIAEEKARITELDAQIKQQSGDTKALTAQKAEHKATVAQLNAELVKEKQALDASKQSLAAAKQAEKEALQTKNQLQQSSDQLRQKIAAETTALSSASNALKKMGIDTSNLDKAIEQLKLKMQQANNELERVAKAKNFINGLADGLMAAKLLADQLLPSLRKMTEFFQKSIDSAASLEFAMSGVAAVSGANAAETERLTAVVKKMGATTIYTANEAAAAMKSMALAGWDAQQMIAGLPSVVRLAASANEDLAQMTTILVDGMNAFNMSGTEDAIKFADVLAKTATSASTNVSLLGQSLSYVQGTAGNLGYSVEDVGIALAAMANSALKGSVSGSALNTALTRMSGSNQNAAKQMEEMGLSMYYANGQAKPLIQFLNELRAAFRNMGMREAQDAAYRLAGMRGMRGLMSITNLTEESWQKLISSVYDYQGAAMEISSISMDNYTGQMYLLTSAWDALKTSVGEKFVPAGTRALEVLTDITTAADGFAQNHENLIKFAGGFVVSGKYMLETLGGIAIAAKAVQLAFNTLKLGQITTIAGLFGGMAAAAGAIGLAFVALTAKQDQATESLKKYQKTYRENTKEYQAAVDAIDTEKNSVTGMIKTLRELSEKESRTAADKAMILEIVERLNAAVPDLTLAYDKESDSLQGLSNDIDGYINSLYRAQRQQEDVAHMLDISDALEQNQIALDQALEQYRAAWDQYQNYLAHPYETNLDPSENVYKYEKLLDKLQKDRERLQAELDALKEKYGETEKAQDHLADSTKKLSDSFSNFESDLGAFVDSYKSNLEEIQKDVSKLFKSIFEEVEEPEDPFDLDAGVKNIEAQVKYFEDFNRNLEYLRQQIPSVDGLGDVIANLASDVNNDAVDTVQIIGRIADELRNVGGQSEAIQRIIEAYHNLNEQQELTSNNLNALALQFDEKLTEIKNKLIAAIGEMDQKDLATDAAQNTIQAFINKMNDSNLHSSVRTAAAAIGQEAINAINEKIGQMNYLISNANSKMTVFSRAQLNNSYSEASKYTGKTAGFASGTSSATPGIHLVGEKGPELVTFRGGEQVIPADKTRNIFHAADRWNALTDRIFSDKYTTENPVNSFSNIRPLSDFSAYSSPVTPAQNVTLNVSYHIASADSPSLRDALRQNDDELSNLVRRVMRQESERVMRSSYL